MRRVKKPDFTRADYDSMYADFLKAVENCARETKRNFRRDDSISVWVAIAFYRWTNRLGLSVRQKPCSAWRVPAVRFWPGGMLPAILTEYPPATPITRTGSTVGPFYVQESDGKGKLLNKVVAPSTEPDKQPVIIPLPVPVAAMPVPNPVQLIRRTYRQSTLPR
jgi:hypothetical protein